MVETVVYGAAWLSLLTGSLLVRRRSTGRFPHWPFWAACCVGAVAAAIATIVKTSGVALAVPVIVIAAIVILRDRWWLGDAGILCLIVAAGTVLAYFLAAAIDPDTGSSADQGALAIGGLGAIACLLAMIWSWLSGRRSS